MAELRRWLPELLARPGRLALGAGLLLLTVLASVGLLALAGWFITAAAVTGILLAAGVDARLGVFVPGAVIRALALVRTGARYGERLANHDAVLRILAAIRARVFAALAGLDARTLARFRSADTLNRLTADVDALDNLYLRALVPAGVGLLALVGVCGLLLVFAPAAAWAAGGVVVIALVLAGGLAGPAGARSGERAARAQEALRHRVLDLAAGLAELRAFGSLGAHRRATERADERLVTASAQLARRGAAAEAGTQLGVHLAALAALAAGTGLHAAGTISGPVLVLLPLAVLGLGEVLPAIPAALVELGRTRAAARRLNAQLDTPPAVREPAVPAAPPAASDVRLANVGFGYGAGTDAVFADLSLEIAAGEVVAVVGASGAGKSTLGDLVARVVEPAAGEVRLGGVALGRLRRADVVARVGYLTQHTELFADTIAANLRLARPDATPAELWRALADAGLADFVEARGDGLAAWVGEGGVRLSGGQARRLALARVLLAGRPVAVLDEPLAGLDGDTAAAVADGVGRWLKGRTGLLLGHDPAALPRADRVLRLDGGVLEACG